MLINFSVQNYRSFGDEQTLNLVASNALKDHDDHCIEIPGTDKRVLRTGVVYGANAAGKSNLVRAIRFAQELVLHGPGPMKRIAIQRFRFADQDSNAPSAFEFRFMADSQVFVYGFEATAESVVSEWLTATNDRGKEIDVFSRDGQDITIGSLKSLHDDGHTSEEALKALKLLGARANQLLLNKIVDLDEAHRGELLERVVWWFAECLTVIEPESSYAPLVELLSGDHSFRNFAGEFLSSVGTGVAALDVETTELSADNVPEPLIEGLQASDAENSGISIGASISLQLDPDDPSKVIRRNLASQHTIGKSTFSLPFNEESDGTQRVLHLLPALHHLANSCNVFVIDELDRSLHPLLSHALLNLFVTACSGGCQQMIVTTHETNLLDQDLFRRDEIWFVEKDAEQQTQLHSLADLKIRNDLRIRKSYLQGRFGGVPFIGGTDRLKDFIECETEG